MINPRSWAGAVALVLAAVPALAQQPAAGRIKVASGAVFIVRAGELVRAQAGQDVFEADSLRTGADGRLGITMKDDTRVSLGPGSEVRLDRFVYAPADGPVWFRPPGRSRRRGIRIGTDRQALAGLHPPRNASSRCRRPWNRGGDPRHAGMRPE